MSSSKIREITDLFAQLALNLKTLTPLDDDDDDPTTVVDNEEQALNNSVSNLNSSLNLEIESSSSSSSSSSRVRVLDTLLSLMLFQAPQVYDTMIKYLLDTLVTVLSSSIACKPLKVHSREYMRVGGEITKSNFAEFIEAFEDILQKLEGHGTCYQSLLYALVNAAVSASSFRYGDGVVPILDTASLESGNLAVSKLLCHLPSELLFNNEEIPLRLLFWYLDPMSLKNDISNILKESINRPFICVETEFHEKMEWRSILMCLALSPAMFVETRALLHNWFLMTGLASVLGFEIKMVISILNIISRPMRWGLSMDAGLKLPSSCAYFSQNHNLLRTLDGPILGENLQNIVYITNKMAHHPHELDHKSPWAMAMNFPNWFYLASTLLFRGKSIQDNDAIYKHPSNIEPAYITSARYIAWIVDPTSESHQKMLIELLNIVSESWVLKRCSEKEFNQKSVGRKKLKKVKTHVSKDDHTLVQLWLEEFQDMYINYLRKTSRSCIQGIRSQQNALLWRIPLGILIGYLHEIEEDGSQLLLHYATTGKLGNSKYFVKNYSNSDAVTGVCLVFEVTDILESMSSSLFETEEREVDFVCSFKLRAVRYLLSCVERLLEIEKGDDDFMLRDLYTRLGRWRLIGKDVLNRDFDDVIDTLSRRISPVTEMINVVKVFSVSRYENFSVTCI